MNVGRTFLGGPVMYDGKAYNLCCTYNSVLKIYNLEVIRGDWQLSSPTIVGSVTIHSSDQTVDPRQLLNAKVSELNAYLKQYVFTANSPEPPPVIPADWVGSLEAFILALKFEMRDTYPTIL